MFNRNPHVSEPMNGCVEGQYSMFAEIFEATKKASQVLEEKASGCQVIIVYSNFPSKTTGKKKR